MEKEEMLERLEAGYSPIDIAIEKWINLSKEFDTSVAGMANNCALCHVYIKNGTYERGTRCDDCPIVVFGYKRCAADDSPFDYAFRFKDASYMLKCLQDVKEKLHERECKEGIKEKTYPEPTYSLGDVFDMGKNYRAFLCTCEYKTAVLIDIPSFNRWSEPVKVQNVNMITVEELKRLSGSSTAKLISGKVIIEYS